MANAHHSKAKYAQIARKLRGQKRNIQTCANISNALMGHKHSPETLAKMKKPRSKKGRMNISKAMMGKVPWNKGKTGIYSKETIEKIRQANLGKKRSLKSRTKQSKSVIARFKSQNPSYIPPSSYLIKLRRKHSKIRQERMRKNGGKHSEEQWNFLKAAYKYQCVLCNKQEPNIVLTKDHIIPVRNGGNDDIQNIQPLCRSCNSKKR